MRRRLAVVSLATTSLLVLALIIPLGLLVRRQAADRARVQAEQDAQALSGLVGLALATDPSPEIVSAAVGSLDTGHVIALSDESLLGQPEPGQGSLIEIAFESQATVASLVEGGWEVALPVIGRDSIAVVDVYVTDSDLTQGVLTAWLLLAVLGVVLVGAAGVVADRLGASLVGPIRDLADSAHRIGEGDLETRLEPTGPEEIRDVGEALNQLARRLDQLLREERESVADLSHRLRTPMASLRLQTEKLGDEADREQMLVQVDRLEQAIDQLISTARSGPGSEIGRCVLDEVVLERVAFWRVLADEQSRNFEVSTGAPGVILGVARDSVEAVIDALVGNVFDHTPAGTGLSLRTGESDNRPWLELSDRGPGFADSSLVERGHSGGGSTGLGLDIAKRTAEMTGGTMEVSNTDSGAKVRVWFG